MSSHNFRHFAVCGNPIAHSLSPCIHQAFATQFGLQIDYQRQALDEVQFAPWVKEFFRSGGVGLNITLPFKQRAFALAEQTTSWAQRCGAANTLWSSHGKLHADNTDGAGLVNDVRSLGWQLANARLLVLGAGGAVAGIVPALQQAGVAHICLANRTLERADELARLLGGAIQPLPLSSDFGDKDLVLNALSIDSGFDFASLKVRAPCWYDLSYSLAGPTVFAAFADGRGKVSDGLGMLVRQAAESFAVWHGVRPQVEPVLAMLRE